LRHRERTTPNRLAKSTPSALTRRGPGARKGPIRVTTLAQTVPQAGRIRTGHERVSRVGSMDPTRFLPFLAFTRSAPTNRTSTTRVRSPHRSSASCSANFAPRHSCLAPRIARTRHTNAHGPPPLRMPLTSQLAKEDQFAASRLARFPGKCAPRRFVEIHFLTTTRPERPPALADRAWRQPVVAALEAMARRESSESPAASLRQF